MIYVDSGYWVAGYAAGGGTGGAANVLIYA